MDNFFIYMSTELNKLVDGYKEWFVWKRKKLVNY
jgi:hypothetical protein